MTASLSLLVIGAVALAAEPTLTISTKSQTLTFTQSELLERTDLETITIKGPPGYKNKRMEFTAIKVSKLFAPLKINDNAVIQFKTLDGFSAPLAKARLLNTSPNGATAYIAVESPDKKWPPLSPGKPSAGPFFLIWKNPELSNIGSEEWPYNLASFEVKGSLASIYPKTFPSSKSAAVNKGYSVFVKNCFACHTMNKQGASDFGPDLNLPMNPTEYFTGTALRKLIRNPQTVRHWPKSRMKGFAKSALSDRALDHLISYLEHMAKNKSR